MRFCGLGSVVAEVQGRVPLKSPVRENAPGSVVAMLIRLVRMCVFEAVKLSVVA